MTTVSTSSARPWVPFLLIALAVLCAHGFALRADFYMDDKPHILTSERIQDGLDAPSGVFKSRHLTFAVWRSVHVVFGNSSVAYHAVNFLLHLGTALLFLPVARRFLRLNDSLSGETQATVAFWGTLLFAVHPLVTEPVNYAAQTSMLLMMFFATLAAHHLLSWHESKRRAHLGWMVLAVLLASHAKEPGIFHASILLFLIGCLVVPVNALRERLSTDRRLRLGGLVAGGALAVVFVGGWAMNAVGRFSDTERMLHYSLSQSRVLGGYLSRVLLPTGLSSDHYIAWTMSLSDVPAVIGLVLVVVSALAILYHVIRRRSWLAVLFGLALFHLYLRYAYSVDELMVEYRLYPAMPWIGVLLALGITKLCAFKPTLPAAVRPVAFASLALVYTGMSAARSQTWRDEETLTLDVLKRYPQNIRAWSIYFGELSQNGDYATLAKMRDLPQHLFQTTHPAGYESNKRQFMAEKTYRNFIACQYPLIKALIHEGETDEALRRSDMLLVNLLEMAPTMNSTETFAILMAKLLAHSARGESSKIEETITGMAAYYDEVDDLRRYLAIEVKQLPAIVAATELEEVAE